MKKLIDKLNAIDINSINEESKINLVKNLPIDYLAFMNTVNGHGNVLTVDEVLDLNEPIAKKDLLTDYGQEDVSDDFFLFAEDGMGGYFAFSVSEEDNAVYYLDHESCDEGLSCYCDSFAKFLQEIIEIESEE